MDLTKVLHMKGGVGETSYAKNSFISKKVLSSTKQIRDEAITNLYNSMLPRSLAIADLGCSSGPNTFSMISDVIRTVEKLCHELNHQSPEYKVFFNDLPGNDFNSLFKSLDSFNEQLNNEMVGGFGPCFFAGVPGSFYGLIFPSKSLHFVHSAYSLQWLSQVPEGVENNKGNIYMASTSPSNIFKAYYEQFQKDFSLFLKCRSEEVVEGGRMVLTFLGRRSNDPSSKECCLIWELLATALNHMGIIKEKELDSFNVPMYTPSPSEVEEEVVREGSFSINGLQVSAVSWKAQNDCEALTLSDGENMAKCIRSVAETLLISHFGEGIIEEVFRRYQEILNDYMSKEETEFVSVTISVTKRALGSSWF